MASGIYDNFKSGLFRGTYNCAAGGHVLRIALVAGYTFDASHTQWANVSANEITGAGYTAGGAVISSAVVVASHTAQLTTAGDITWGAATLTASGAVIYDVTAANSPLVAYIDFGGNQSSSGGNFTISWTTQSQVILSIQ